MSLTIGFIHIPKTGGMSVFAALKQAKVERLQMRKHRHYTEYKPDEVLPPLISVVRNPFDRMYSIFEFYKKKRGQLRAIPNFRDFINNLDRNYTIGKVSGSKSTNLFDSCSTYLQDENGRIAVDHILRFERLEEDFNSVCEKYNITGCRLRKENINERKVHPKKTTIYDYGMRGIIEERYKDDIINFGYTYEQFIATPWD